MVRRIWAGHRGDGKEVWGVLIRGDLGDLQRKRRGQRGHCQGSYSVSQAAEPLTQSRQFQIIPAALSVSG